ncbi:MAG TPA: TIGR03667 family PPOX class F420-dependent oxidoreductase [Patescibacteria group bacterium]|nr:TIGR03667 family PPOX class F420-dependent oxidoreductase [Patescibacteria group bacterium]
MLDLKPEFGHQVNKRLLEDEIIWFTTVSPSGTPTPNPVWFLWDGKSIVVYSQPGSYRVRNIKHNSKVSLHLEGADVLGNNVIIITGEAILRPDCTKLYPGYLEKYIRYESSVKMTIEEMLAAYSVEIRVKPLKIRGE